MVSLLLLDYIIIDSDIDKSYLEISAEADPRYYKMPNVRKLLEDKLYAHQHSRQYCSY
jgi:hypothetical protein